MRFKVKLPFKPGTTLEITGGGMITVSAATELVLEPLGFEPAKVYQKQLFAAGIPATAFQVDDIEKEYERLLGLGVIFSMKTTQMGPVMISVFYDTCGNNMQIYQL